MNAELSATKEMELWQIGLEMEQQGLSREFITAAVRTAVEYKGVYHMMVYWRDEHASGEREQTVADIQDMIDECTQRERQQEPYIRYKDLGAVADNIMRFKDGLREKVDANGGIGKLAAMTGIPQPSLSRFFNSASRPRRSTLLKIARALELDERSIVTEWSK